MKADRLKSTQLETIWQDSRTVLDRQFAGVSDDERRPIVRDHALRFFGLG